MPRANGNGSDHSRKADLYVQLREDLDTLAAEVRSFASAQSTTLQRLSKRLSGALGDHARRIADLERRR